jgi:hypothetical protein
MADTRIYDLGDLRKSDPDFVIGPLFELISSGICPILIGSQINILSAFRQCHTLQRKGFKPVLFHETVPEVLRNIGVNAKVIGVQQHIIPHHIPDSTQLMHLSQTRNTMTDAETLIRESTSITFDLSAMSRVDLPAQKSYSSSGFCTEEACMLMRFAGLHQGTTSVMISGHDPLSLELDRSANTCAQLIWYFLEAYNQCIPEDPATSPHFTSYAVHLDLYDSSLKFFKSERTARWWVELQSGNPGQIFPCTYKDYQAATNGQLSDRLLACASAVLESR